LLNASTERDGAQVSKELANVAPAVPGADCPSRTRRVFPEPGVYSQSEASFAVVTPVPARLRL
jgi:hypothetical protein